MGKYVDKDQWLEEVLIPDTSTSILGGQPVWEGDRLIDGFANISTAILADRTRHLKNKVDSLEFSVDVDFKNVLRKENNLSDLLDIQQAKYNLELNLVDNVRDMDKPVSNPQQAALNLKADKTTTISVGAGLTGGGNLSANRTITLGTPSTITGSTANQATTGTHTHALSIGIADVSGLTSALAGKEPTLTAGTATQYYRGDKTWQTLNTGAVAESTNLYFTENRVRSAILAGFSVGANSAILATDNVLTAFNKTQGQINYSRTLIENHIAAPDPHPQYLFKTETAVAALKLETPRTITMGGDLTGSVSFDGSADVTLSVQVVDDSHNHVISNVDGLQASLDSKQPMITAGTTAQYYRGDKTFQTLNTAIVPESGSLYFTENRVRASILTGFAAATNTPVLATDNILTAFNKIQGQINSRLTANQNITISGDATGSGNTAISLTLANSGVTAGTYTKATVDSKGRVVSGTTLSASDIPNLDWSKITSGKPTTLAGYGITDGLVLGNVVGSTPGTASAGTATTAARSDHVHPIQTTVSGNAGTATRLATARTINGVSFDGTANITINAVDSTARIAVSEKGAANGVATLDSTGKVPSSQLPSYVDDVLEYANLAAFPTTGEQGKIYIAIDTEFMYRWSGSSYIWINASAGSADVAIKLAQARTIAATGDASWSVTFDGSSNASAAITLSNSGVTAGTYNNSATQVRPFTVDAKGRITGIGTAVNITPAFSSVTGKPTTLSGYGITDATPSSHIGSGGTSHANATTTVAGFMSAADKSKLNGIAAGATANTGTVTSVGVSVPTGLSVTGSPVTGSGVLAISYASGYSIPTTAKQGNWDTAYGWGNHATAGYAASGHNHTLDSLSNVTITSNTSGEILRWNGSQWVNATLAEAGIQPSGSYLTGNQNITVTGDATGSGTTSIALTLANSGVTAGTYTKTTVDAKGRVTAGTSLVAGDIPNLDAGKITSGTLADARLPSSMSGKTFSSPINVNATFNINGSGPGQQQNGIYVADLGSVKGTTENPVYTTALAWQQTSARSNAISIDGEGYLWGFRSHSGPGTYTFKSKVKEADTAIKLQATRAINGVYFDGSADIDLGAVINTTIDWNTLTKPANYSIQSTAGTNRPTTNFGTLIINGLGDRLSQTFVADTSPPLVFTRISKGSVWGAWEQIANISSNVASATKLANARQINGTNFDGTGNITTANWGTTRTLTVGNTGKSVNGSGNVSWSLAEIGAAASSHNHDAGNITSGVFASARIPSLQATKAQVLNGTSNLYVSGSTYQSFISWNALGTVSTGNVTIDLDTGINFTLTVGGNITIVNPTNADAGKSGDIYITMSAAGVVSWGTNWKFLNKVPEIGANGELWMISYKVVDASNIITCASKVAT